MPFPGVWAKIERAKQHLAGYERALAVLRDTNLNLVRRKDDPQARRRIFYLDREPIIPTDFALLAGDVIQCLRSALDHLAYALCVSGPGGLAAIDEATLKRVQFPISKGDVTDYKALPARSVITRLSKPGVEPALDATEPYGGGAGDLLSQISVLNNTDKHRLLVTVGLQFPALDLGSISWRTPREWVERFGIPDFKPPQLFVSPADKSVLKAGDIIYTEPLDGREQESINLSFPIALNEPQITKVQPLLPLLQTMTDFVSGLVSRFDQFA